MLTIFYLFHWIALQMRLAIEATLKKRKKKGVIVGPVEYSYQ